MPCTSKNFAHIEITDEGIQVLFYLEHDGDDLLVHQVVMTEDASMDVVVRSTGGAADKIEELWPEAIQFPTAAPEIVKMARGAGLSFD